jgi:hypothetical protein
MFTSFEESVMAAADDDGNLSTADAQKLLFEHGFSLADVKADDGGLNREKLDERNAETLLAWLGY